MIRALAALLIALLCLPILVAGTARAETGQMSVFMKNGIGVPAAVEVQAMTRAVRWPGDGQVWMIEPKTAKSAVITCEEGERLCWAAWVVGDDRQSFGIGADGSVDCRDCCFLCVKSTTVDVLLERE